MHQIKIWRAEISNNTAIICASFQVLVCQTTKPYIFKRKRELRNLLTIIDIFQFNAK